MAEGQPGTYCGGDRYKLQNSHLSTQYSVRKNKAASGTKIGTPVEYVREKNNAASIWMGVDDKLGQKANHIASSTHGSVTWA
jgi:hypothetical protein